ncbi:hypothetical protein PLESTB_001624500 [Pleodorina starrii]|uniref:Uncharacterized protein n=1 Tax=Pleodorina starrii TaxID=330485 RepID=A0A9W6F8N6_9CHLO|nr:hypothetical protein PLESTM_001808300 [Pleodorina starrii]GLC60537.1 hypothetical protein PLESTB_001624500 [Pleodorina starrii]GLC76635.1 hypothetical protein PLESTF_001808200 [Pleodorina starrii]
MILAGDTIGSVRQQRAACPGARSTCGSALGSRCPRLASQRASAPAAHAAVPFGPADTVAPCAAAAMVGALGSSGGRRLPYSTAVVRHRQRLGPCRSTLDTPEISELVDKMIAARPPPGSREKLSKCLSLIEDINSNDPSTVEYNGRRHPYRVLFGSWLAGWVEKLDPGAPDELFILTRGKNIESWRLVEIKRDDYSPNTAGQKQWQADRKAWLANRLKGVMKEADYGEASQKLVEDFMLNRDLPDPRDVRLYDVTGPMGAVNYRLLELLLMVQTLRDAEALVFLERTFPRMFEELPADEVLAAVRRELAGVSRKCLATALQLPWSPLQRKLLSRALPAPPGWGGVLRELEGVAAASTHPGDWRYRDFDYE